MHNISHKKPVPDFKVYLVMGATTYLLQLPMGVNMEPISYKFAIVTGLKSALRALLNVIGLFSKGFHGHLYVN